VVSKPREASLSYHSTPQTPSLPSHSKKILSCLYFCPIQYNLRCTLLVYSQSPVNVSVLLLSTVLQKLGMLSVALFSKFIGSV